MTPQMDPLATPMPGGFVMVGPTGAKRLLTALRIAEVYARQTGGRVLPDSLRLRAALEVSAERFDSFASETIETPALPDPAGLGMTATSLVLLNPIGVTEAARLLHCSEQWVRACCRRGKFASARRRIGGWVLERDEVAALAG